MSSADPGADPGDGPTPLLDPAQRQWLLDLARRSIAHGLTQGVPVPVVCSDLPPALAEPRAAFVTLHRQGALRGCIGHLEPVAPLAEDVADNAFAAAFRDPRFEPVTAPELDELKIEISVLGQPEPLPCDSEAALLAALRPGSDGVILAAGQQRGTFLPSVWAQLPDPADFLRQLKRKAGLPATGWPSTLRAWRYGTESFGEG